VMLPLVPVILAWVAWRVSRHLVAKKVPPRTVMTLMSGRVILTVALFAACILPWTIRNYKAFGQFVLLNTNAGFAFFWGNHPIHGTQFIPILPEQGPGYGALIPAELLILNEAQMDKELLRRGLTFVFKDPLRYVRLSVSRIREYFRFWPSADSSKLSNCVRVMSFGICFPFMLSGLVIAFLPRPHSGAPKAQQRNQGVMLVVVTAGLYTLIHLLSWTLIRYRLAVDAMAMPFAALSVVFIYDYFVRGIRDTGSLLQRPAE